MSHRDFYPRWIELPTGQKLVVNTHQQHSAMLGQEFDECANPVARRPKPPTIEDILAEGYGPDAAEAIFATEQRKEVQGIEPYGDKPVSEYVPEEPVAPVVIPFPEPVVEPPPAEEEFPEPFYPPAAEIQPDAFADDPLGIFEPGVAEEEFPVGAATPDKPAKRRGKNRE